MRRGQRPVRQRAQYGGDRAHAPGADRGARYGGRVLRPDGLRRVDRELQYGGRPHAAAECADRGAGSERGADLSVGAARVRAKQESRSPRSSMPRKNSVVEGDGKPGRMPPRMGAWQPERLRYGAATKNQRVAGRFPERENQASQNVRARRMRRSRRKNPCQSEPRASEAEKKLVGRRKRLPHKSASPCAPTWDKRFRLSTRRSQRLFHSFSGSVL